MYFLGGVGEAATLLKLATPLYANTINPNYTGTGGRFGKNKDFGNLTAAGVARAAALAPATASKYFPGTDTAHVLAISEVGGRNMYLNDRFFTDVGPSQQDTVFIHELHRLGGYRKSDLLDYANITKACGTANPWGPKR